MSATSSAGPEPTPSAGRVPRPYSLELALRWSDMDAYGHVNNVQFLRYLEGARIFGFYEWFGHRNTLLERGVVIARHEIDYLVPLTFRHDPIEVAMWVSRLSPVGYDLSYEIRDPERVGDTLYARAESSLVAYDFQQAAPRRLSAHEQEVLGRVVGEPAPMRSRTQPHRYGR